MRTRIDFTNFLPSGDFVIKDRLNNIGLTADSFILQTLMAAPQVLNKATNQTARRWILSIGGAGIVATGAILGAGLREERDYVQVRHRSF